jgi:phospholipase/lecithinase/hemolysin
MKPAASSRSIRTFTNAFQRIAAVLLIASLLAGCALPVSRQAATLAVQPAVQVSSSAPTVTPLAVEAPAALGGIGILGDSTSDEYRAEDARGGDFAANTLGWVEQLVKNRKLNFGAWGQWDEPRRTGYEYNWARTGATANTMHTGGQVKGLAEQVAAGKVSFVLLWIGGNDFHMRNGPYEEIYNGTLHGADLQAKLDGFTSDVVRAMDIILAAGKVKMAVVTVTDQGMAHQAPQLFPDPAGRQKVTDAINAVNVTITKEAEARGVLVIDSNQLAKALFARYDSRGYLVIGGQKIDANTPGDDPHHLQLGDWIGHSGTVLSGIIANSLFIEPFNKAYQLGIQPLSDEEILKNAGLIK